MYEREKEKRDICRENGLGNQTGKSITLNMVKKSKYTNSDIKK